jgi:iron-sulfur cluster repair protein YtfE (RIC family)
MTTIAEFMATDHRHCDQSFADAEALVSRSDWNQGADRFQQFLGEMERHFSMEEEVLFPAFEEHTGQSAGPTQVMRSEHAQMRQLLQQMSQAVAGEDKEGYLGLSETLMIVMQQHNMKEEQMLYPMTDRALESDAQEVIRKMESV